MKKIFILAVDAFWTAIEVLAHLFVGDKKKRVYTDDVRENTIKDNYECEYDRYHPHG